MTGKQKDEERRERKQQRLDAGPMSDRYPQVASIVVAMDHYKKGSGISYMHRTVNFFPGSAAYFLMECMEDKCIDGGYDLDSIIYTMVRGHQESADGELACAGNDCSGHRRVGYKIAIEYS